MSTQFDVTRHRIVEEHNLERANMSLIAQTNVLTAPALPQEPVLEVIYKNAAKLLSNATGAAVDYTKATIFTSLGLSTTNKVVTKVLFIAKTDNGSNTSTVKISQVSDSLPIYPPEGYRIVEGNFNSTTNVKQAVEDFTLNLAQGASVECQIEWYEI